MQADPVRSARWRLALRFTLGIAALLVGSGLGVHAYARHLLLGAFDSAHDLAIHSVLENVAVRGDDVHVDARGFAEEFEELNVALGVVAAVVWSADGRELARAGVDHEPIAASGPPREVRGDGGRMVVVRREPLGIGPARGVVAVSRRAGDIARDLESLQRALTLIVPFALLAALGFGWMMAGRSLAPVRRAFEQQRAFMADTSHELRTPLAVLRAHAEVHADGDPGQMRAALAVVSRSAAHLSVLVDDLFFLARADAAALSPRRLRFSMNELVEEAVLAFEPRAAARGSKLVLASPPDDVEVEADPAQIQRLVALLVDNAVRHADPGDVEVSLARAASQVVLRVEDGGPGIPPDLAPRVFDRFVRGVEPAGAKERGFGLGLAIAKSIVIAHGGSISLARGARGGVAAVVRIPRSPSWSREPHLSSGSAAARAEPSASTPPTSRGARAESPARDR
ncbi:MAG: HAMP domain-containing histidine kinase [Labilithrix sp.]|nr:HAMP domain-containing histidine kinase [Labilithrix sp.]